MAYYCSATYTKTFFDKMLETVADKGKVKRWLNIPFLVDLDDRFRKMDEFGDYRQILSLSAPPIEAMAGPEASPDLARLGNDGMAEYCRLYKDRFPGFIASLPLNTPEASLIELHRCMKDLKAVGVQLFSTVNGTPINGTTPIPALASSIGSLSSATRLDNTQSVLDEAALRKALALPQLESKGESK